MIIGIFLTAEEEEGKIIAQGNAPNNMMVFLLIIS
jgi:hypothetical protein